MDTLKTGIETASKSKVLDKKTLTEVGEQAANTAGSTIEKQKEVIGKQAAEEATKTIAKQEEILKILQFVCDNSIYTYQNQICNRIYNC